MKSKPGIQIILLLLVLTIVSFDRHFSAYYPGEVKAMIESGAIPAHNDFPVKSSDSHEDISLKNISNDLPAPIETTVQGYGIVHVSIPGISQCTAWRPPKMNV